MNLNDFVNEKRPGWDKLQHIHEKIEQGKTNELEKSDIWDLNRLYVGTISDLSLVRSSEFGQDPNNPVLVYLNSLLVRVHGTIYRKAAFNRQVVKDFVSTSFPDTLRSEWRYLAVSTGIFLFFALLGFVLGITREEFIPMIVSEKIISTVESGKVWFSGIYEIAPMASSRLMTHNISVTFLCIASGITFGIGTVYLLGLNGLLIGTVAALCYKHNLSYEFWSFVLPHGSLELSAIFIGGAAAFIIGHSLIDPGPFRRSEFIVYRSRKAGVLALGCVPLLIVAGIVEAFFSPAPLPGLLKFLFASASFSALLYYCFVKKIDSAKAKLQTSNSVQKMNFKSL